MLNERNFQDFMLRTETRPKIRVIESFIIFRIYFAEVSGWGREFVVCKCCKDEIKICVISLLCVKINLLTKISIIPLNERYVSTKEWVPAAEDEIRMLDSQNMSHLSCSPCSEIVLLWTSSPKIVHLR